MGKHMLLGGEITDVLVLHEYTFTHACVGVTTFPGLETEHIC